MNPLIGITVATVGAGPMIAASGGIAILASLVVVTDKTLRASTVGS